MTRSRSFSGGKPKRGEDRVVGGRSSLVVDPFLNPREAFGGLMDIVAIGDIGECFQQLFEALGAAESGRPGGAATRRASGWQHSLVVSHLAAFPHGIPARTRSHFAAG